MVKEANLRQAAATRELKESSMKVDVLSAEVAALKTLVLTSTPSHPNLSREDSISMPGMIITFQQFFILQLVKTKIKMPKMDK